MSAVSKVGAHEPFSPAELELKARLEAERLAGIEKDVVTVPVEAVAERSNVISFETGDLIRDVGVERVYTTKQAAGFFDRSVNWMYWGEGDEKRGDPPKFVRRDGTPIVPKRGGKGKKNKYRQWTLKDIRDIAVSCYDRQNLTDEQLVAILKRIAVAEAGGDWREIEIPEE